MNKKFMVSATLFFVALNLVFTLVLYLMPVGTVEFIYPDKITGMQTLNATSYASLTILGERCQISVDQYYNFVSLCAIAPDRSVATIMNNTDYTYILKWNASAQKFLIYHTLSSNKEFSAFDLNESYFVYTTNPAQQFVNISGPLFGDLNVSMLTYYNAPTYPYLESTNISNYLNSITGEYIYTLKWDEPTQKFLINHIKSSNPDYTIMNSTEGQFIYVTNISGATLQYIKANLGT